MRSLRRRRSMKEEPAQPVPVLKERTDYTKLRPGKFVLLTVDMQPHPDYEPVPVRYNLSPVFQEIQMDREVTLSIEERGASGFGVVDDETGELVQRHRMTIYPHSTFTWEFFETALARREAALIERQRRARNIL